MGRKDSGKLRGGDALDMAPPDELFQHRLQLRRRVSVVLLNLLTVVLLTASFTPFDCWYFAYVALVPWALGLGGGEHRRWTLMWGWLAGVIFWGGNLYWLTWITLPGYVLGVLYLSVYWLVAGMVVRAGMRRNFPTWIVLPVVWVALEYVRSHVLVEFPWLFLGHTQYSRTRLIQIADLTGQYGVSFFVAMVNGAIIDLLWSPIFVRTEEGGRMRRREFIGLILCAASAVLMVGYGTWRVSQDVYRDGPVVGIVQHAYPISLGGRGETAENIFTSHLDTTRTFINTDVDLVVWPETMLPPPGLNRELLETDPRVLDEQELRSLSEEFISADLARASTADQLRSYLSGAITDGVMLSDGTNIPSLRGHAMQLESLSRELSCPILAGGSSLHRANNPSYPHERWVRRNSSLWFDGSWKSSDIYSKVHLVPFSERVPFKDSFPWLYRGLRRFVPAVMPPLDPGRRFTRFELKRNGHKWFLATPICYEGTFARICRSMVMDRRTKAVDILVNLSNDGWFVLKYGKNKYHASTEHTQHLVQYCFRAVENRVPVIRAVNTGISASIDSCGRIVAEVHHGAQRAMVSGTLLLDGRIGSGGGNELPSGPKVVVDTRVSLYSLVGDVFAVGVLLAGLGLSVMIYLKRPGVRGEVK